MRKRYRWDPKLRKVVFVGIVRGPNLNNTFQAGDIPDIVKDANARKRDMIKKNNKKRLQAVIQAVEQTRDLPEADTYQQYKEREMRSYE